MRWLASVFLAAGLLFPGFAAAAPASAKSLPAPSTAAYSSVYDDLNLFNQAFDRIRRDAVQQMAGEPLVRAAIAGMLASLDPHGAYFDKKALSLGRGAEDTVGLAVTLRQGTVRVIAPREGSPAAAAGIKAADIILTIGKKPAGVMTLGDIEKRLQGPPGSVLELQIERAGIDHPLKVKVTRALFSLQTVSSRLLGDIGYIRLAGFDAGTPAAVAAAISDFRHKRGKKLIGIILDLRNNPGGNFASAVKVADEFLDKGVIALIEGPQPPSKPIRAKAGDLASALPMVVLINRGTADEAELLAAALKDNRRAVLVGRRSFGESAIEAMIPLADGGAIRLATTRFLTPDGRNIEGKGISPDIAVKPLKLVKIKEGLRIREADLPGALKNPDGKTLPPAPAAAGPGAAFASHGDEQLVRAADILRALAIAKSPDPW